MNLARLVFIVFVSCAEIAAGANVTLSWDSSGDPMIVGYRIYWGVASNNYNNMLDIGNATTVIVPGLVAGTTYYFAVTDYDINGIESGFSGEVVYTPPIGVPQLVLALAADGEMVLSGSGPVGYLYEVQATDTLTGGGGQNWAVLGSVTVGLNNLFQFLDWDGKARPSRFYRLRQIFP